MLKIAKAVCGAASLLAVLWGAPAAAQTIDPHQVYEKNCAACHASHAGDFVHDSIDLKDGAVIGRKSGRSVKAFLEGGHGGLSSEETAVLVPFFAEIRESGRLYHDKCLFCHERAVTLARSKLEMKNGKLVGRYTGRDIESFLEDHGRLTPDEVARMVDVLKRQIETMPQ